jgi:hypothetical protein
MPIRAATAATIHTPSWLITYRPAAALGRPRLGTRVWSHEEYLAACPEREVAARHIHGRG